MSSNLEGEGGRVTCYIDGFNFYHGLSEHTKARAYKWLNYRALIESLLPPGHALSRVVLFTALPPWSERKRRRQLVYLDALATVGVEVVMGRFQRDQIACAGQCGQLFDRYVEKETDVNIAATMLADASTDQFDWAYLTTGDADQAPTLRALRVVAPQKRVCVIFPPRRHSTELEKLAHRVVGPLGYKPLKAHQFPEQIVLPHRTIQKPAEW